MVFAAHVLAKRRRTSKETAFTVGGREITADDVERYWRRKQQNPDTIPDVHTPPGLTYRTPSPLQDSTAPSRNQARSEDDDLLSDISDELPQNVSDDEEVAAMSRRAVVTELFGKARCSPCQQGNLKCFIEEGTTSCLLCHNSAACLFQRSVLKTGHLNDFSWDDMTGMTSANPTQLQPLVATSPTNTAYLPEAPGSSLAARPGSTTTQTLNLAHWPPNRAIFESANPTVPPELDLLDDSGALLPIPLSPQTIQDAPIPPWTLGGFGVSSHGSGATPGPRQPVSSSEVIFLCKFCGKLFASRIDYEYVCLRKWVERPSLTHQQRAWGAWLPSFRKPELCHIQPEQRDETSKDSIQVYVPN